MYNVDIILSGIGNNEFDLDSGGIQLAELKAAEYLAKYFKTTIHGRSQEKSTQQTCEYNLVYKAFIGNKGRPAGSLSTVDFAINLIQYIQQLKETPRILHFTNILPYVFLRDYLKIYKTINKSTKVAFTIHNSAYSLTDKPFDTLRNYQLEWEYIRGIERELIKYADKVFCTNQLISLKLEKSFQRKVYFCPNTVGSVNKTPVNKAINPIRFVNICRFSEEKNLLNCMDAYNIFLEHGLVDSQLILAGEGNMLDDLITKANELKIKHKQIAAVEEIEEARNTNSILILPYVKGSEKKMLWNKTNILLSPSTSDISSLTGLEAIRCGIPIVGSDTDAWNDFLQRGAYVKTPNPYSKAEIALSMLATYNDLFKDQARVASKQIEFYSANHSPEVTTEIRKGCYE